jgi:transcriptional regulator with XRE-family HTH domain
MGDVEDRAEDGKVLAKATGRASKMLGLSGAELARTIGLSESSVARLLCGEGALDPRSREGALAMLLVRVYRSLDALVGTNGHKLQTWMVTHNMALGGVPQQLVQTAVGLVAVADYLEHKLAADSE